MMTPLMRLLLLTVAGSVMAAPHWDNPVTVGGITVIDTSNEVNLNEMSLKELSQKSTEKKNDYKTTMNSNNELNTSNLQENLDTQKFPKVGKKFRKHKNFHFNYPHIPQINKYKNIPLSFTENQNDLIDEKTISYRKKQQESNIFYVRLPPTPYYFVPGLGYISNPPIFSSSNLHPQQLNKPHNLQNTNSFINLPIDFVSNGKPTSVYQWENNNRMSTKRPNTPLNKLKKGPYGFNGRPTSLYLLTSDGKATMHQPIRYSGIHGNNIY